MSKIADLRRENLHRLVETHGATDVAKRMGWSGPSYIGQMLNSKRPITEKTARKIEEKFNMAQYAMDARPGEAPPYAGMDHGLVGASIRALSDALEETKTQIPSAKFAELVALVYEQAAKSGKVDPQQVRRLIRLVK